MRWVVGAIVVLGLLLAFAVGYAAGLRADTSVTCEVQGAQVQLPYFKNNPYRRI